jgi:hypothetical protein
MELGKHFSFALHHTLSITYQVIPTLNSVTGMVMMNDMALVFEQ